MLVGSQIVFNETVVGQFALMAACPPESNGFHYVNARAVGIVLSTNYVTFRKFTSPEKYVCVFIDGRFGWTNEMFLVEVQKS